MARKVILDTAEAHMDVSAGYAMPGFEIDSRERWVADVNYPEKLEGSLLEAIERHGDQGASRAVSR